MKARTALVAGAAGALIALLAPMVTTAAGSGEFAELVHERHENFEEMGDAFKVIRDAVRSDAPLNADEMTSAADVIAEFAPQIQTWFPAGSGPEDGYKTDALQNIWRDNDEFMRIARAIVPLTERLQAVASTGERGAIVEAFSSVGRTCKECHDSFRED